MTGDDLGTGTAQSVSLPMDNGKIPFLVTLILAIIGWAVTHVVDRISSSPTIEFQTSTRALTGNDIFIVQLTNLSSDHAFRNLLLQLQAPTGGKVTALHILPVQPAFEGDDPTHVAQTGDAWFKFAELQPEGTFYAEATYVGDPPKVRISLPTESARIVAPSLETALVRNELKVLLGLIGAGIGILLLYWFYQLVCRRRVRLSSTPLEVRIVGDIPYRR